MHAITKWLGWLSMMTFTLRRCPKGYLFQFRIDYSTLLFFVSFWYRKVKNNISAAGTSGKNALKSVKLPSFSIVENWHSPVF